MNKFKLLSIIIILVSINSIGQDSLGTVNKNNTFFVNFSPIPTGFMLGYERVLLRNESKVFRVISCVIEGSFQKELLGNMDYYPQVNANIQAITGVRDHHFVYGGGIGFRDVSNTYTYKSELSSYNNSLNTEKPKKIMKIPNIKLGYRYQKPNGKFMFNTGVQFSFGFFIGGGISF